MTNEQKVEFFENYLRKLNNIHDEWVLMSEVRGMLYEYEKRKNKEEKFEKYYKCTSNNEVHRVYESDDYVYIAPLVGATKRIQVTLIPVFLNKKIEKLSQQDWDWLRIEHGEAVEED